MQPHASAATTYTWNSASGGNWSDFSFTGWNAAAYPNDVGDGAIFTNPTWGSAAKTFNLDVDATIGALTLATTQAGLAIGLTLSSSSAKSLTFDATGTGPATLSWAGSQSTNQSPSTISVPIFLNDDLVATGTTGLILSGNITGSGKKLTVNSTSITGGAAQLQLSGNNSALTGGIFVNNSSTVTFSSLSAMGGGGNGSIRLAAGSVGVMGYAPTVSNVATALAMLDSTSQGMFAIGYNGSTNFAINLSGITNIRFGTNLVNYQLNAGTTLTFDFANNGNKYAMGGITSNSNNFTVSGANIFTGNRNLEVLPLNLIFTEAQNYSGSTTLSDNPVGTTTGSSHGALNLASNGTILNTSSLTLNQGSILTINNQGIAGLVGNSPLPPIANLADRVNDAAAIEINGGRIIFTGNATADSTETLGAITVGKIGQGTNQSLFTVTYGGTQAATVTAASLTRSAGNGTMMVNGLDLGKDSTSTTSVSRLLLTTAPSLVGTTNALSTGINAAAQNTKIVPFLVGASTVASGGNGTALSTANTFMTYNATTGLRPLNPTDEFTNNAIVSGNNTYITAATSVAADTAINSIVINGSTLTLNSGRTLTITSGALLFVTSNHHLNGTGTTLAFGSAEALITNASSNSNTINPSISGSGGLTKSGGGTLTLGTANSYSGDTAVTAGTLLLTAGATIGSSTKVIVRSNATFDVAAKASGFAVTDLEGSGTVKGLLGQAVTVSGHLTPGDAGIGTMTISAGNLTLANGAFLDYQIGGTTSLTLNDSINLTQAGSTVSLGGIYTLNLFNLGTADPAGKTFVIFDSAATIAGAGTWNINYGTTGWTGGTVSVNPLDSTQVIISGLTVVPEPSTAMLFLAAGGLLLARRRLIRS